MAANYQHLRAFHAIATEGGVSRAARRLNVSQPTLSQQLKALEARHGVSLFESRKVPLRLSTAGRDLFTLTQKMFGIAGEIDELLGEAISPTSGLLRIGSDSPYYSARLVTMFLARHPFADVQLRTGNAREVMRWLGDAQIDAAVASDPVGDATFSYLPLFTDDLSVALPVDHPLTAHDAIPIAKLVPETLILRERISKTRALTERALQDASITVRKVVEMQSREAIREAIAFGLGISMFISSECPPDPRIAYRPLDAGDRRYQMNCYLVFQSERRHAAMMRALQATIGTMVDDA